MVPNWSSAYKLAQTAAVARVDGDGETRIALGEEPALRGELSCGGDVVGQLAVSDRSPLVAELLGHGYQGASRHAEIPAKSWLKYANS